MFLGKSPWKEEHEYEVQGSAITRVRNRSFPTMFPSRREATVSAFILVRIFHSVMPNNPPQKTGGRNANMGGAANISKTRRPIAQPLTARGTKNPMTFNCLC